MNVVWGKLVALCSQKVTSYFASATTSGKCHRYYNLRKLGYHFQNIYCILYALMYIFILSYVSMCVCMYLEDHKPISSALARYRDCSFGATKYNSIYSARNPQKIAVSTKANHHSESPIFCFTGYSERRGCAVPVKRAFRRSKWLCEQRKTSII